MVPSSRRLGAEGSAPVDPERILAPRTRRQIAAAAAGVRAAGEGAARAFTHPAARAALADGGVHGAEAARLLAQESAGPQAFEACLWRWALADDASLARTLAQATALEQALTPAFMRFLDDMLNATPSAPYEALRRAVRRLHAFPEDARARAGALALLDTFAFAMMTGPVALQAAIDWSLRAMGDALRASVHRPMADLADPVAPQGFHDLDAPAAYGLATPIEDDILATLGASALAEWLAQPDDAPPRRAVVALLARAAPAARFEAALEAAAARRALAEAPDAQDLYATTRDVFTVLGAPFIARATCAAPLAEADRAVFIDAVAALASHPVDGRALRAGRIDPCDMAIRFAAAAARVADACRARALRPVFIALYESGAGSALAEIAAAHACLRGRIAESEAHERIAAGAHLLDMAGFAPRALRAGLALRRLCEADGGALAHAWRPPAAHANFLEHGFAAGRQTTVSMAGQ